MTWFNIIKENMNVRVARAVLEGHKPNEPENRDECCERAKEAAERVMKGWGDIGTQVIATPAWKEMSCANLREELELFADMRYPNIQQVIDAWDRCYQLGVKNDMV